MNDNIHTGMLPSFPRIRQQNLDVLYGNNNNPVTMIDKSRMGHVDPHIQRLVDSINQSIYYVTLSSCSGRIVLFDPNATATNNNNKSSTNNDDINNDAIDIDSRINTDSGKGSTGSWLYVSHDVIADPLATIVPFFFSSVNDDANTDVVDDTTQQSSSKEEQINIDQDQICYMKFEPMLLHVAACNIDYGQQLLQIALQNGLRESGLIVTKQRVTVALRTHSLAISIPLSFYTNHIFYPKSTNYIIALTNELNRRLLLNLQLINKVYDSIQQMSFITSPNSFIVPTDTMLQQDATSNNISFVSNVIISTEQLSDPIPDLNLYGHTTVDLITSENEIQEILIFGGYGIGPKLKQSLVSSSSSSSSSQQSRSSSIYRLILSPQNNNQTTSRWNAYWEKVPLVDNNNSSTSENNVENTANVSLFKQLGNNDTSMIMDGTVRVQPVTFEGRLHSAGFNLTAKLDTTSLGDNNNSTFHILLFGGRYSPKKPLNDLLLFEYNTSIYDTDNVKDVMNGRMMQPLDIRGTIPTPRWGHTLTPFYRQSTAVADLHSEIPLAILIGGRNTDECNSDAIYVLSMVPSDDNVDNPKIIEYHFLWEPINFEDHSNKFCHHLQRFYHTTTLLDDNYLFVFGGLNRPDNLLSAFDMNNAVDEENGFNGAIILSLMEKNDDNDKKSFYLQTEPLIVPRLSHRFGHTATCLYHEDQVKTRIIQTPNQQGLILLAGGVSVGTPSVASNDEDYEEHKDAILDCLCFTSYNGKYKFELLSELTFRSSTLPLFDAGPLIHHGCIPLKTSSIDHCHCMDLLLIGGGVSGFAFQELYAPSHYLSFQWTFTNDANSNRSSTFKSNNAMKQIQNKIPTKHISSTSGTMMPARNAMKIDHERYCDVVYVLKQNAKSVKTSLESLQYMDKRYRMTNIDLDGINQWHYTEISATIKSALQTKDYIAIPILPHFIELIIGSLTNVNNSLNNDAMHSRQGQNSWRDLIVGYGKQVCLQSTGTYARGGDLSSVMLK